MFDLLHAISDSIRAKLPADELHGDEERFIFRNMYSHWLIGIITVRHNQVITTSLRLDPKKPELWPELIGQNTERVVKYLHNAEVKSGYKP